MGILVTAAIVLIAALSLISAVVFGLIRNHRTPAVATYPVDALRRLRRR